jgi:hypothetical protein
VYGERSSKAFYLAVAVALGACIALAYVQYFVSAYHSAALTAATSLIGGALVATAALTTWRKLS